MMVMYKYTKLLIHNSAFTQHTHKICCKKNLRLLSVYMLYRYKTIWHETTGNIHAILICFVLYHTQINWIITTQSSQKNDIFVDVSIYQCIDTELCDHCFGLPHEYVPINIVVKYIIKKT